ncbi:TetR/AcrR family transcriptional regulator C-terminal domain-containing protein [Streptomyces sp. SID13031]|uniref:TetR/AcrR family transcriptional regulator n=1 Tax=Streptomyces sp. SID13031 TaxID=2706046 RepID=UPI0013C691A9|nr:TetR/AcrR family transcriptional regulator C-terminal domain-containing protein [Streptomyces sp. SID13031]NEA36604.1 TetR family transcriptional regulator [Streptomyces sp. SID13031]
MPREKLTREQIVQAAVAVLDAEGVDGLNVRRLGAELGMASTAMYWHVKNKDDLVVLAGDHVWREIELPDPADLGWRAAAAAVAASTHAMISRHFWLVSTMSTHLIYGPGKARVDDHCLGIYETAGFSRQGADQAAATMLMFVIGAAQGAASERAWEARLRRTGADHEQELRDTIDQVNGVAQGFPRLRDRLLTTNPEASSPEDDPFQFGLRALLDGLEARLTTGSGRSQPSS